MQREDFQKPEPPISAEALDTLRMMDEHFVETWKQLIKVEEKVRSIRLACRKGLKAEVPVIPLL